MTPVDLSFIAEAALAVVAAGAAAYAYFRSRYATDTIALQQGNIEALQTEQAIHNSKLADQAISITALTSEIVTLKTLPLADIAKDLQLIMSTQNKILEVQNTLLARLSCAPN